MAIADSEICPIPREPKPKFEQGELLITNDDRFVVLVTSWQEDCGGYTSEHFCGTVVWAKPNIQCPGKYDKFAAHTYWTKSFFKRWTGKITLTVK